MRRSKHDPTAASSLISVLDAPLGSHVQRNVAAVIVRATVEQLAASISGDENVNGVPLGPDVTALVLSGSEDMLAYGMLASKCAEELGAAVMMLCMPDHSHQVSQVFRKGARGHAFRQRPESEAGSSRDPMPQHFAGAGESWVEAPLVEGLALAGINTEAASVFCRLVGGHEHPG